MIQIGQLSVRQASLLIREFVIPHWKNCIYCDKTVSSQMTLDHIIAKANYEKFSKILPNGMNSIENFLISCKPCNNHKGNMHLTPWIIEYRPETPDHLLKLFKELDGIIVNGIDYGKGVRNTILQLLKEEKTNQPNNI